MAETMVAWLQTKPKSKNQYILYGCVKKYATSVDICLVSFYIVWLHTLH